MRTGGKEELSDDDTRLKKKLNFVARASKIYAQRDDNDGGGGSVYG